MGDPYVRDALPVRLLVSGALYGRGKRNEATARIVAPPAFEPKSFQVTLDAHDLAWGLRSQDFRLPVRGRGGVSCKTLWVHARWRMCQTSNS
jgi:hypothetical protein